MREKGAVSFELSARHTAFIILFQTSSTPSQAFANGWLRWIGTSNCLRVDPRMQILEVSRAPMQMQSCGNRSLRVDPHRSQVSKEFVDNHEKRGVLLTQLQLKPTLQMGQVENNARYLGQMGMRTLEDLDVGETSNSCWAS